MPIARRQYRRTRCLGVLGACLLALAPMRVAAIEQTVTLTTEPAGATVCEKTEQALACDRVTPATFVVDFRSSQSSKRYYLRKLGYEPVTALIRYSAPRANLPLRRQQLFPAPDEHASAEMRALQQAINAALPELIYGGQLGFPDYIFFGRIQPINIAGKYYVKVEILLDDAFRSGPYRRLSRIANDDERLQRIAEAVLRTQASRLTVAVAKAVSGLSALEGVMLVAKYAMLKLTPVDDDSTFTHVYQQVIGQTVVGNTVYYNYRYTYTTLPTGYTKLEQESRIQTLLLYARLRDIPGRYDEESTPAALLRDGAIFLNDNPTNEMVELRKNAAATDR